MRRIKIGPGTQVLNQSIENPMGGVVVPPPEGEIDTPDMADHVWVQWCDRSIGNNGITQEYVNDLTLTGCLVIDGDPLLARQLETIQNALQLVLAIEKDPLGAGAKFPKTGEHENVRLAPKTLQQMYDALLTLDLLRAKLL